MSNPLVSMVPHSSYTKRNLWLCLWTKFLIKNIPLSFLYLRALLLLNCNDCLVTVHKQ